jgi:hypothetical protein
LGKVGFIWQKGNLADGEEGRRPWRRNAVPGEGPANTGIKHAHEHHWDMGRRFPYVD